MASPDGRSAIETPRRSSIRAPPSGVQPEEVGRRGVPVAQPEMAVEAEDGIREARRELRAADPPPSSGSGASAAASATT